MAPTPSASLFTPKTAKSKIPFLWDYFVSPAPAFFSAKSGAAVIVAWSRPLPDGRYRCELVEQIDAAEARDLRGTTQRIAAALERMIRRHPSAWILNYDYFRRVMSADEEQAMKERVIRMLEGAAK